MVYHRSRGMSFYFYHQTKCNIYLAYFNRKYDIKLINWYTTYDFYPTVDIT